MELKFDLGFRVIGEYLSQIDSILIESQFDSILFESQFDSNINLQLLGIPDQILVPPVTQLFTSKWLHFFFQSVITI